MRKKYELITIETVVIHTGNTNTNTRAKLPTITLTHTRTHTPHHTESG